MENLIDVKEIRDLGQQKQQRENRVIRVPEVEMFFVGLIVGLLLLWSYITYLS